MELSEWNFFVIYRKKTCEDRRSDMPYIPKMLKFTPSKDVDVDDIDAIITPPLKGENLWMSLDTPTTSIEHDGSFTEISRKPLGRFLSFDVKRCLFSGKRPLGQQTLYEDSPATKRLREAEKGIETMSLQKSSPEGDQNVKNVVHRLSTDDSCIADGSRPCTLPTVAGKHRDLKSISPETMNDVLSGCYDDEIEEVTVIDCRYPYEYEGGHIKGALNLYTRDAVFNFLSRHSGSHASPKRHVLIFHCEFSSERGPKLFRYLRGEDRAMNKEHYPRLNFPEVYLLEGGYKAFFYKFIEQCQPQAYKPMLHKDHTADLRHFREKSKSWTCGERPQLTRTVLRF